MKIYFLHGKESSPKDKKLILLSEVAKEKNFDVKMVDFTDTKDPNERALRLANMLENESEEVVLMGSSMGGYASVWASTKIKTKALFLTAPALFLENRGYQEVRFPIKCENITIVHGYDDSVVPVENSILFAKKTKAKLHLIDDEHSLTNSHVELATLFELFLENITLSNC